ncbi:MAG: GDYXXLXY domain-containing protein [Pseudomonadota bacterium]
MQRIVLLIATVFVLLMLNVSVYQNERLIRSSETMLLELAPADPRSLMQGDYMRLRYAIATSANRSSMPEAKRGFLVIKLDSDRVAQFVRYHDGEVLEKDERLLRYHRDYSNMRIVPDSFFFQEGHAAHYEESRYGQFKINNSGKHLLVGLADEKFQPIEPKDTE